MLFYWRIYASLSLNELRHIIEDCTSSLFTSNFYTLQAEADPAPTEPAEPEQTQEEEPAPPAENTETADGEPAEPPAEEPAAPTEE